ncbi:hypothetical protein KI387_016520, partial [Taxus chinensis]
NPSWAIGGSGSRPTGGPSCAIGGGSKPTDGGLAHDGSKGSHEDLRSRGDGVKNRGRQPFTNDLYPEISME